ncbi:hypothetical protein CBR_g11874 [Chara braunii]|uniref:Uncharacterized protein n=1 Tax=Chara braunii TaxID=69332 RepID=A0A388JS60_CHABU|nr:hypothetical protein CBR_g11874 [Chara braunii]|eukprot:GBG60649.1 hypothetical protein CBR_g11874 [Chara braunii]
MRKARLGSRLQELAKLEARDESKLDPAMQALRNSLLYVAETQVVWREVLAELVASQERIMVAIHAPRPVMRQPQFAVAPPSVAGPSMTSSPIGPSFSPMFGMPPPGGYVATSGPVLKSLCRTIDNTGYYSPTIKPGPGTGTKGNPKKRLGRRERRARLGGDKEQVEVKRTRIIIFQTDSGTLGSTSLRMILDATYREGKKQIQVVSEGGKVWGEDRALIKRLFGTSTVVAQVRKITLSHSKTWLEEGGRFWISPIVITQNARDRGKGYLQQLLEMPFKRKELSLLSVDKLMHLYNCAGTFKEKEKRRLIKDFLGKAVGRKAGVNIRKRITVQVRYSREVKKSGIRSILITQIESCGLHPAIARIFKRKARVVSIRNKNVAEILCDYKQLSKKPELYCTCKHYDLPIVWGHVLARIADVTELPTLLLNGKNVVRPRLETTEDEVSSNIRLALTDLLGEKMGEQLKNLHIAGCFSSERGNHCDTDEGLVYSVKKRFRDLLITQVDRNAGDLVLMCPSTYHHGLDKLFSWNVAYDEVSSSETEILKVMKKDFVDSSLHKLANWNSKGRIGQAYVLPKHKDLERWRPIAPACSEPTMTGSKWRALNFLLEKLPGAEHFNLTATALLKQNLKKAERKLQQYGKDTMTICGGFDIKEMFTSLPHSAILEALSWLLGQWEKKGYQKITVCKRRKQVTLGLKTFEKGYVKFSFS